MVAPKNRKNNKINFVESRKKCNFATGKSMFSAEVHKSAVQKHKFPPRKHKFSVQKHKKASKRKTKTQRINNKNKMAYDKIHFA